jgi:predicted aminopeptidase
MLAAARPVESWLADPATPPQLRERLKVAQQIREFASRELGLPENGSYSSYAELNRPFAVWNVYAAPELSIDPKQDCFPITGCVSYRGFFSEDAARRHAAKLRERGYDVFVGGVAAYSTLGYFDDPLLSTFIRYPDAQLARLIFHELAHQRVYVRDDSTFNESFAVVIEEEGVKRWLEAQGRSADLAAFRAAQGRRRAFAARVQETRERLAAIYATNLPREAMLEHKRGEFERLRADYPTVVPRDANNAYLISVALYTELVPAFERLLAAEHGDLQRFYAKVGELAKLPKDVRDPKLDRALAKRNVDDFLVSRPRAKTVEPGA